MTIKTVHSQNLGGKLLSDLFEYDKKGKFIFVGDPLQLPPIGQKSHLHYQNYT